jgi:uncharacterized metal-binding protein YceD (DUF177 family)
MEGLIQYTIPIKGIGNGIHEFEFQADHSFFQAFEHSSILEGAVTVKLIFEKRPELYVLNFALDGTVKTECDRCLVDIHLPISNEHQLLVKLGEEESEENDPDVIYIHPETPKLQIAQFIYEYIHLSIPMIKVYDCQMEEEPPCNEDMLKYLEATEKEDTDQDNGDNPIWDALKNLDL